VCNDGIPDWYDRYGYNLCLWGVNEMARYNKSGKKTYGKSFRKKTSGGKFKKGTLIQYTYQNGRRVGARKAKK
jgi:predicted RNA-binding protein